MSTSLFYECIINLALNFLKQNMRDFVRVLFGKSEIKVIKCVIVVNPGYINLIHFAQLLLFSFKINR